MKDKREFFSFKSGKYVVGDVTKIFEEKEAKKIKSALLKLKAKGGFNKKFGIYYFRPDVSDTKFMDYIEKDVELLAESCLVMVPDELAKKGRLSNCRRFNAKNDFQLQYLHDSKGIVLYFQEPELPGPFMMLVQANEA